MVPDVSQKKRIARGMWAVVGLLALVVAVLGVQNLTREAPRQLSDGIFDHEALDAAWMDAPQALESGASLGLKPGLKAAQVVIPNRPHDMEEAPDPSMRAHVKRRRTFSLTTDARGLRRADAWDGLEFALPAPGTRILCVGPSISLGWGVAQEQSYPALLAQRLGVQVINAGAPAAEPGGLARWVETQGAGLDADLVVVLLRPDYPVPDPYVSYARAIERMATAVSPVPLVVALPPLSTFDNQLPELERLHGPGPEAVQQDIRAIVAALGDRPVLPLTTVFREGADRAQPAQGESLVVLERTPAQHRLLALPARTLFLEAPAPATAPTGDDGWLHPNALSIAPAVLEAFASNPHLREPLFFDGGHPDAEGYALIAEEVARWIQRLGLLPG
jgi:lysophospholipase L1-like esterase